MSTLSTNQTRTGTRPAGAPSPAEAPTFIVGSVRSGTTLLRLMLDHHPEIAFHFEFEFAVDRVGENGQLPAIDAYHDYLRQDRVFLLSGGRIDPSLGYVDLVNSFLEQRRQKGGKRVVGATVHHGFEKLPHLWPEAKFIHLSRDGRDVSRSCIQMGWAGNMYCAADRWVEAEMAWTRMRKTIPLERQMEVRYEDLIEDAEATLGDLCRFMGCDFDPAIFQYAKNSTYELPDPKLLGQWRKKLTQEQVQLSEARIGDMLVERGYELSGYPRIEVTPAEENRLRWRDWWSRAQFRWRRYGGPLFATDFLARRLGIGPLARHCKRLTDAADNRHIR